MAKRSALVRLNKLRSAPMWIIKVAIRRRADSLQADIGTNMRQKGQDVGRNLQRDPPRLQPVARAWFLANAAAGW